MSYPTPADDRTSPPPPESLTDRTRLDPRLSSPKEGAPSGMSAPRGTADRTNPEVGFTPREPQREDQGGPGSGKSGPRNSADGQVQVLQGEVDRLLKEMEILRGWFQTLVSGLLIAVVISVGIASWFAYRLLDQEEVARQQLLQGEAMQQELQERVNQLEDETAELSDKVGAGSAELRGTVQNHQVDLEQLRDRLNRLETRQASLEAQNSAEAAANKSP